MKWLCFVDTYFGRPFFQQSHGSAWVGGLELPGHLAPDLRGVQVQVTEAHAAGAGPHVLERQNITRITRHTHT